MARAQRHWGFFDSQAASDVERRQERRVEGGRRGTW